MTSLNEYINLGLCGYDPPSRHVEEPGFRQLAVRFNPWFFEELPRPLLDICNVDTRPMGHGIFKRRIARVQWDYPDLNIVVEAVTTARFAEGLVRMGFVGAAHSCYLLPAGVKCKQMPV